MFTTSVIPGAQGHFVIAMGSARKQSKPNGWRQQNETAEEAGWGAGLGKLMIAVVLGVIKDRTIMKDRLVFCGKIR